MEGVRDATSDGTFLGIEGADGRTTLATANLAARADLTEQDRHARASWQPRAAL